MPSELSPLASRALYRRLLHATAYPGELVDVSAESEGMPAWQALLQCLLDDTTSLADADGVLDARAQRFLRARIALAHDADFVLARAGLAPSSELQPRLGELESPELGASLILIGETVGEGPMSVTLEGPGIAARTQLRLGGVHPGWLERRNAWVKGFPLGVDLYLCDSRHIAVLPRTTVAREEGP